MFGQSRPPHQPTVVGPGPVLRAWLSSHLNAVTSDSSTDCPLQSLINQSEIGSVEGPRFSCASPNRSDGEARFSSVAATKLVSKGGHIGATS